MLAEQDIGCEIIIKVHFLNQFNYSVIHTLCPCVLEISS